MSFICAGVRARYSIAIKNIKKNAAEILERFMDFNGLRLTRSAVLSASKFIKFNSYILSFAAIPISPRAVFIESETTAKSFKSSSSFSLPTTRFSL